jgi:RNA polymerase sigma-70 factor (ECF subfamily)
MTTISTDRLLAQTLREESGPLVASLARRFGDFDLAEEAVAAAVLEALTSWRRSGPPDRPGAWLQVAAQRNALDAVRRAERQRGLARRLPEPADSRPGTDDRLALLFACCHPALAPEARLALTLRAVVGLTTPQIARAFLVNEATLAQRIVRAKRKIVTAGISLSLPPAEELATRLDDVLAVVYLTYNEGFVSSTGHGQDRDLAEDAVWLAEVVATSLPGEPEAWGLAALLRFQHARAAARFDTSGDLVLLADQDRTRWDDDAIALGEAHLERAAALERPGRFQLQAAIAACHASSPTWEDTDWLQIATLYDVLVALDPSPVARLNRAVARAQLGPSYAETALVDLDGLAEALDGYHLFHATRAELLARLGRDDESASANARALELTTNDAERRLLLTRLHRHPLTDGS